MSRHNAHLDVRGDLRVRGRIEDNLRVSNEVEAAAFYIRGVGEVTVGTTDHGALTGLSDDDHTQYLLVSGARAMAGDLSMGSNSILGTDFVNNSGTYSAGLGSVSAPSYRFQVGTTGIYGVDNGRDIGFSSEGIERAVIGRDGLRVNDKVEAEAFYLSDGGEFSVNKTTIRSNAIDGEDVSHTDPVEIYVGDDGIVYAYDPTRDKNLSVGRSLINFGRAGTGLGNNIWLSAYGTVSPASLIQAAAGMPRNYTLLSVSGTTVDITTAPVEIHLQARKADGSTQNFGEVLTFYITAADAVPKERRTFMDIDFNKDDAFAFITQTSGTIDNPKIVAEIAWRDS